MSSTSRSLVTVIAALAWATSASSLYAGVIGSAVNPANGHTYYLLEGASWTDSQAEAVLLGGNLATVRSQAEHDWIVATFGWWGGPRYIWIGLNDVQTEGEFVWASREPVIYTNWQFAEPDDGGGVEDYVVMLNPALFGNMPWGDSDNGPGFNGLVEFVSSPPPGRDIDVPSDYTTIQAAIDAALDGDRIIVAPGTYVETIDFKGKAITVKSTGGPDVTTIDGGGIDSVVRFVNGESKLSVLDGFTIRNGHAYQGGGVYAWKSSPTICGNVITGNAAGGSGYPGPGNGGGILVEHSSALIVGNVISFNDVVGAGGGITIVDDADNPSPVVVNNFVAGNTASGVGGGILVSVAIRLPQLTNNTITGNTSGGPGGGIYCDWNYWTSVSNCIAWNNAPDQIAFKDGGITVEYSDVQDGWPGIGNIDMDPLFVDPLLSDFHVGIGSPCVDSGTESARDLPATDFDGDARDIGASVDIGADEVFATPDVVAVTPWHARYDRSPNVTISGSGFTVGTDTAVFIDGAAASNVVVVNDATITCDMPSGDPGPADVVVSNSLGQGTLAAGFTFTPSIQFIGTPDIGASITIRYLCDPGDALFAIIGLPPEVTLPTSPYDGTLCILPFRSLFFIPFWPFDEFSLDGDIPNDPQFSGVEVLFQALVGPSLTSKPKDGVWTNCATMTIQ